MSNNDRTTIRFKPCLRYNVGDCKFQWLPDAPNLIQVTFWHNRFSMSHYVSVSKVTSENFMAVCDGILSGYDLGVNAKTQIEGRYSQ